MADMTRAGELRHRITFQANTPTANGFGEFVDTYSDTVTVYGAIEPLSGSLLFTAQQANSEVQGRVRIRYRDDIEPSMRIKFGTRYFKILSVINPSEKREELQILVKEFIDA
jgi:SPP1 family predicted phage head-tail adaptor